VIFLLWSLLFHPVSARAVEPSPEARELMQLDFFEGGRGMHLSPGILNKLDQLRDVIGGTRADESLLRTLTRRWGLQEHQGEIIGIKTVKYKNLHVGVLGCVACHSGKAAGQHIVGIGNKNIDPGKIGMDGVRIEKRFKALTDALVRTHLLKKSKTWSALEDRSIRLMEKLADPRMSALTQGLVPVSLVGSWFYEMDQTRAPDHGYIGAVKVPSWFGFEKKLQAGQFADGIGRGHPPGWIIGVEITSGQTPEQVRAYFGKVEKAVSLISALTPPPYPFTIDRARADRGKTIFDRTCAKCHGTYSYHPDGKPVYEVPKFIPLEKIGTDPDRLDYVTPDFLTRVLRSPLQDLIQLSEQAGQRKYIAPRLHAIWARFPYLHNGSVPTIRDLLEKASDRPVRFSLKDAGERYRFDPVRMGLTRVEIPASATPDRVIYDTRLHGQTNQGHEKFIDLSPTEKDEIIEYLKTL
jgi:hypothetical protein